MCLADAAARALEGRRAVLAMQKLTADAAQAALVLEHSADAIITVTAAGRVVRWNTAAERLFGHAVDDIVGQPIDVLVPPDRGREEADVLTRIGDGRAHGYETVRLHRDGRPIDVAVTAVPQFDAGGQLCGGTKFVRDITERRRAERSLQDQKERLRLATDAAGIGVWELDPSRGTVEFDDWMHRLYDLAPGDPGSLLERWSQRLHPGDAQRVVGQMTAALKGHGGDQSAFRVVWGNGEVRHLQAAGHVVRDATGRATRVIGVNVDVTLQRRSEDALRDAKQAAEAANASKSAFLANMSHEIRTPMNAILGMLALLRRTEMTPRQADYAAKTESAARSLLGLLNDILDFSKVEAGKMTLDAEPFRVERLMDDLAVILSASVGTKPLEVLFDIDPAVPPRLLGDAMRLQQVLINLGGNALKFTTEGEVVISIAVRGQAAGRVRLEFAVSDTGIGIAPENQARIFAGFTQAEASTTRRFGGTGLGLAISQRLVALMGGDLRLTSALGQGTRFHFCIELPVVAGESTEPAAAAATAPATPHVLIVDDNPTARTVLARAARSLGWQTEVAADGEQALARVRTEARAGRRFDAVFADWRMPGWDGWETLRRIRDEHASAQTPAPLLLMVTANGREALLQRSDAEQALIAGFLVKPVTVATLAAALQEAQHGGAPPAGPTARQRRLQGLRLLLAEDNANNQQVARELLEDEGASVHIAADGRAAVDAVAAPGHRFDAVLMDLQMPVMDGYAAAAFIRRDLQCNDLPIIAMTANAMASDRAACFAAGMNDHVGKPFDLDDLVRVVRRHTGREEIAPAADGTTDLPPAAAAAAQTAGVNLAAARARMGGRLDVYTRMLRRFLADLETTLEQLRCSIGAGSIEEAARLLHTLKGLAGTLGIDRLAAAAGDAEKGLGGSGAGDAAATQALCDGVCTLIDAARQDLLALQQALVDSQRAQPSDPPEAPAGAKRETLVDALRELSSALERSDMVATTLLAGLQTRFSGELADRLQTLDDTVSQLDFEAALAQCAALIEAHTA
jgi:PAS domain S-box-containing protein